MHFLCSVIRYTEYTESKKQPVGSVVHEVLAESLKTVFDEAHFIVNLHSFLQSLAPRQNNFQNSPSLDTSATALASFPQF